MKDSTLLAVLICCFLNEGRVQCQRAPVKSKNIERHLRIRVGRSPGSIEIADFNQDSLPDLVVASELDSTVTILLGKGDGTFVPEKNSPFSCGPIPNDIVIKDINKDGHLDLAIANHECKYVTILFGNGEGSFIPSRNSPFKVDVLPHVHGVALGDFNSDKQIDLVVDSWANDHVAVFFGYPSSLFNPKGIFLKAGKRPYQRHRVADLNHDGNDDIITTNSESNNCTILLSDGKGNFKQPDGSPFACGDAPFGIAIADVNADSSPDLAIVNSPGSMAEGKGKNGLTVLIGDGKGNFKMMSGSPFEGGKIPNRIAVGDLNGDKINDIVMSDNDSNKIYLYLMTKTNSVMTRVVVTTGNHPKGLAIADLNRDGKDDIVVCNQLDNDISIIISK